MHIERLGGSADVRQLLDRLDVDRGGRTIMEDKAQIVHFLICDLHVGAANILKQDAISVGGDLAVPKGTVLAKMPTVDALLMVTRRQLLELARKELAQPFGLKALAVELKRFANIEKPNEVKIMGVVNTNGDSFFEGSRFKGDAALGHVERLLEDGADIIDIGGVSSRPGSEAVSAADELARVKPVIDAIYAQGLYRQGQFSIDSYAPSVIAYALEHGFCIVNDITGLRNDAVAKLCGEYCATAVIMHMRGTPQTMQSDLHYDSLFGEITDFFEAQIAKAERFGVEKIVLDVGIGFGKSLQHNLKLIRDLEHFLFLGKPLLVGASRKSMIDSISPASPEERLAGTLALHLEAVRNGAEFIRVHDVKEHLQALRVQQAFDRIPDEG